VEQGIADSEQAATQVGGTAMKSTLALALSLERPSLPEPRDRSDQSGTSMSTRSDIYARPDVYDMKYEGDSNQDARFFARRLARIRPRRVLELARCSATTYEAHLQRANVRLIYDRFDQRVLAERLVTDFASHIYFPAELELLFLAAGFEIAQQYADYRFVRVDRTSSNLVTVARRPRGLWRRPGGHNRRSALRFKNRERSGVRRHG
jgi:hypothetical protein